MQTEKSLHSPLSLSSLRYELVRVLFWDALNGGNVRRFQVSRVPTKVSGNSTVAVRGCSTTSSDKNTGGVR